ncbi:PF10035 family protein [Leptospira santarosai str. CBC523]|uniref:UPF0316 protein LSS_06749 n=4 Tax=Leptospira santarosai TaxID=28183 RepID=K8Y232_9LEPT|nr:PF10035 family protein [Leptospira santarosai str. MOR084]EKT87534.1 hypothetical protein LSS_06749 [Leptospira santarosai serovar Shermani str. LT 821]EMM87840.1 PF10035 family protein [Leptospira santarosai str. 2000027870]EMO15391.1 PF10035 family protein [Leptospira santarosai str. CBC523]EMO86660.1 PF10035 family protein [Leptospira santarosai str. AIM]EMP82472.1 PF10035 family protein [Leptospira santarosai str. CBC1531]EPG84348.1 PF10035 family protein [Leptospira santarosai serovar
MIEVLRNFPFFMELSPGNPVFDYFVLPCFIFFARVTDVSIGTIRVILLTREKKVIAASLGFLEVLLWVVVITQVIKNLNNTFCYLAYAGGFATGTFIGMILEEKLAIGFSLLRIISPRNGDEIANKLSESGYGVTTMNGQGSRGPVKIIFTVLKRKKIGHAMTIVKNVEPDAFYSIENARSTKVSEDSPGLLRGGILERILKVRK